MSDKTESAVHTHVNISNTDIITMLVVKNRKHLEEKRVEFVAKIEELNVEYRIIWKAAFSKAMNTPKVKKAVNAITDLVKVFVSFPFEVKCTQLEFNNHTTSIYYHGPELKKKMNSLNLDVILPEGTSQRNEDLFYEEVPESITEGLSIPVKFEIKISQKMLDAYNEAHKGISKIDDLLRNEAKLKEELIAKVTENAIANSTELKGTLGLDNMLLLNG